MIDTIPVVGAPQGVAMTPDGSKVYVTNADSNIVSVITTATNTVTAKIPVGSYPIGIAVTPDGSEIYVANAIGNTVSVIAAKTNTMIAIIQVGSTPVAFGVFIQPSPKFSGNPGNANCIGKSVSGSSQ